MVSARPQTFIDETIGLMALGSAPMPPGPTQRRLAQDRRLAEFAVIGWTPDWETRQVKSLVLGTRERGVIAFCGSVGSGLSMQLRRDLFVLLQAAPSNNAPAPRSPSTIRWVATQIAAKVEYLELSGRGTIREPVLVDIRGMAGRAIWLEVVLSNRGRQLAAEYIYCQLSYPSHKKAADGARTGP